MQVQNNNSNFLQFPTGFLWGASTSSHQVEERLHYAWNDNWSVWEKSNSSRLAKLAQQQFKTKPNYLNDLAYKQIKTLALQESNYLSGNTCQHLKMFNTDLQIMKTLNFSAYRFGLDWAKLNPELGVFDNNLMQQYKEMIFELKKSGIEPFVTLWHWTHPLWFEQLGAFEKAENLKYFNDYVQFVVKNLKGFVKFYITLNEPTVFVMHGYITGSWPPSKPNKLLALKVYKNLIAANTSSYKILKTSDRFAQVGIAHSLAYYQAANYNPVNFVLKFFIKNIVEKFTVDSLIKNSDFIGLNYYFRNTINLGLNKNGNLGQSDMGWEIYPKGIYYKLLELKKYKKPIYITENGVADILDIHREKFISQTLYWVHNAIQKGVDVKGYLHWSLLDNFEWACGFWPKFGLVKVNFEKNCEREIKNSAYTYGKIIEQNGLVLNFNPDDS